MKSWYTIKAAAQDGAPAEVSILEEISAWFGVNAQSFLAEFRALQAKDVTVYINSPGGNLVEALAMFNGMRASGKNITVHVLGIAASAASYIAMAADKIIMPRNTLMLPHKPSNDRGGTADEHRATADLLDTLEALLLPPYLKRWKGTEAELRAQLAKDEILTAEQCLAMGLCDEVIPEVEATASFDLDKLPPAARATFAVKPPAPAPSPAPSPAPAPKLARPVAEAVAALIAEAKLEAFTDVLVTDPRAGNVESAQALIESVVNIVALAKHAGLEDHAAPLIRGRKSYDEARAALAATLAAKSPNIDNVPKPTQQNPGGGIDWSPDSMWSEIHAMKAAARSKK